MLKNVIELVGGLRLARVHRELAELGEIARLRSAPQLDDRHLDELDDLMALLAHRALHERYF